jgi:hypothetical protein
MPVSVLSCEKPRQQQQHQSETAAMTKHAYSTEYYEKPGITFSVSIDDPKKRVQAYLDSYEAGTEEVEVRKLLSSPATGMLRSGLGL